MHVAGFWVFSGENREEFKRGPPESIFPDCDGIECLLSKRFQGAVVAPGPRHRSNHMLICWAVFESALQPQVSVGERETVQKLRECALVIATFCGEGSRVRIGRPAGLVENRGDRERSLDAASFPEGVSGAQEDVAASFFPSEQLVVRVLGRR